jgi:hypothetical protein
MKAVDPIPVGTHIFSKYFPCDVSSRVGLDVHLLRMQNLHCQLHKRKYTQYFSFCTVKCKLYRKISQIRIVYHNEVGILVILCTNIL